MGASHGHFRVLVAGLAALGLGGLGLIEFRSAHTRSLGNVMPTESGDVTALAVTGALGTATLARTQPGVWTYAEEGKGARPADPRRVRALLRRLFPLPAKRVLPVEPIEMAGPPAFTARVQEGSRATTLKWWTATFDGTSYYARTDRRTTPVLVDADVIDRLLRLSELV